MTHFFKVYERTSERVRRNELLGIEAAQRPELTA